MTRICHFLLIVSCFLLVVGCAGKRVKIDPGNPVYQPKNEFEENYGFFITPDERKKGYDKNGYPTLSEPLRSFDEIDVIDEFRKFEKHFWEIRDTDPSTPQNEFKQGIDKRIENIKKEIFSRDFDIAGTRFDNNGGLKGDLARVYLLRDMPSFKAKLPDNVYHVEMVVWYYLDDQGKVLMSFLFYKKYDRLKLFKDQGFAQLDFRYALREISRSQFIDADLQAVWDSLEFEDPEFIFRSAMLRFSDYSDIVIENAKRNQIGALDPPEPAALTAKRLKPSILGQPDLSGKNFFSGPYKSFIPSKLEITKDGHPSFILFIGYSDVDWEIKGEKAETTLDLRISFQHKATRNLVEFEVRLPIPKLREEVEKKRKGVVVGNMVVPVEIKILLDNIPNFIQTKEPRPTLRQMVNNLDAGTYIVNIYLQHPITKKYNAWREEIVIR